VGVSETEKKYGQKGKEEKQRRNNNERQTSNIKKIL
jgi:hypothetical protein